MNFDFAKLLPRGNLPLKFKRSEMTGALQDRHRRSPTAAEIAAINAQQLIATPLRPADLLFVFGTREDVALRAAEACRLWREGYFRWSIVSGGLTPGSELSECAVIKAEMVEGGI